MKLVVNEQGAMAVGSNGASVYLDTAIVRVNPDNSVTLRIPARDVEVDAQPDPFQSHDMSDLVHCIIAVVLGGLTLAQIQAVRPGVAAAVQTYLTNHGLTAGSVA